MNKRDDSPSIDQAKLKTFPLHGHDLLLPDIVRAENASLFDASGRRYVDLESGVWCTPVGHNSPAVLLALAERMTSLGHVGFCYSSPVVDEAADAVQKLLGHEGGRCAFLCSGSEGIEFGVRAMRTGLPGKVFMTMADSYFGAYGDAACADEGGWLRFDWLPCEACDRESCGPDCLRWADVSLDEIGAFLLEPGSSSGLVRFPPRKLVRTLAGAVKARGGLVMVNEVTTGVGRTGKWFGYQHYGLEPDVVALGKGIGNGYPVSVASLNQRAVDLLGGREVPYGQSHQNDPMGAAVALAVIGQIEGNDLIARGAGLSKILLEGLERIGSASPLVREVRGRGLMAAIELEPGEVPGLGRRLHRALLDHGFVTCLRPGAEVLRLDPPLTVDEKDLRDFLDALEQALREL
jgi:acetylornithine aminotransferase